MITHSFIIGDQLCQVAIRLFLIALIDRFDISASGWEEGISSQFAAPFVE